MSIFKISDHDFNKIKGTDFYGDNGLESKMEGDILTEHFYPYIEFKHVMPILVRVTFDGNTEYYVEENNE